MLDIHPEIPDAGAYEGLRRGSASTRSAFLDAWGDWRHDLEPSPSGRPPATRATQCSWSVRQDGVDLDSRARGSASTTSSSGPSAGDDVVRIESILREDEALAAAGLA